MTYATTHRPDTLVVDASNWMRRTLGLTNNEISHRRVGEHLHLLDCRFDMVTLVAIAEPHPSGYAAITKASRCHVCDGPAPVDPSKLTLDADQREFLIKILKVWIGAGNRKMLDVARTALSELYGDVVEYRLFNAAYGIPVSWEGV